MKLINFSFFFSFKNSNTSNKRNGKKKRSDAMRCEEKDHRGHRNRNVKINKQASNNINDDAEDDEKPPD